MIIAQLFSGLLAIAQQNNKNIIIIRHTLNVIFKFINNNLLIISGWDCVCVCVLGINRLMIMRYFMLLWFCSCVYRLVLWFEISHFITQRERCLLYQEKIFILNISIKKFLKRANLSEIVISHRLNSLL